MDLTPYQHFFFPGQAQAVHYDVVACQTCSFAFASDIPDQMMLISFYCLAAYTLMNFRAYEMSPSSYFMTYWNIQVFLHAKPHCHISFDANLGGSL